MRDRPADIFKDMNRLISIYEREFEATLKRVRNALKVRLLVKVKLHSKG